MKRYVNLFLLLCLVGLSYYSCNDPGYNVDGTDDKTPEILFIDFEKDNKGIMTFYSNDKETKGINGFTYWCIGTYSADPMEPFEVTVHKISGSLEGAFGVVFAAQDVKNFLTVFINIDRQYKIIKVINEHPVEPPIRDWTPSDSLTPGYVSNTINITYDPANEKYIIRFNNDLNPLHWVEIDDDDWTGGYYGYLAEVHKAENFPSVAVKIQYYQNLPLDIGM
jgi:hypothetical protein